MRYFLKLTIAACAIFVWSPPTNATRVDHTEFNEEDIITRDVCVIGGGSAGTYAATRLHQLGQSVIIIERESLMGGHTNTYTVPNSGLTIDYGVVVFHNLSLVRDYFAHYGVELGPATFAAPNMSYNVDFRTGKVVKGFVSPDPTASLKSYVQQLEKYPFLSSGINLPDPVPEDLLIPFKEFVHKFDLANMVQTICGLGQGYADLLDQPSLYALKGFGLDLVHDNTQSGYLATVTHDNHAIYDAAAIEYAIYFVIKEKANTTLNTMKTAYFILTHALTPCFADLPRRKVYYFPLTYFL